MTNSASKKKLMIFPGTFEQGLSFAKRRHLPELSYFIVMSKDSVRGLDPHDFEFECVGSWRENEAVKLAYEYWSNRILYSL